MQEMYCIETLARVDVLCLDKTGTLTTDEMNVTDVITMCNKEEIGTALASIAKYSDDKTQLCLQLKSTQKDKSISAVKNSIRSRPKPSGRAAILITVNPM